GGHQLLGLRGAAGDMVEAVVVGHLQRRDDGAAVVVVAHRQQSRRKLLGVVVDRVAEEDELDQRHSQHHAEGQAVAAHLGEFLQEQRLEPGEGEEGMARCAAHSMLSFEAPMNWMNTSSRLVWPCSTVVSGRSPSGRTVSASASRSAPTTCSVVPNGATWSTPGLPCNSAASFSSCGPRTR